MKIEQIVPSFVLDRAGGNVDRTLIALGSALEKVIRRPVSVDRNTYREQLDFLINSGFTDRPETFFTFSEAIPAYEVTEERPFADGKQHLITYRSDYSIRNPLLQDYFSQPRFAPNRNGYLFHWTHNDPGRPTVLCLHGYTMGHPGEAIRMFRIKRLFKMGLNVALFIAPLHWRRSPNKRFRGLYYLMPENVAVIAEHIGQAMFDLNGCFKILKDRGAGRIGAIGASLGGYHSALFASLSDLPAFIVMVVPGVAFIEYMEEHNYAMKPPPDRALIEKIRKVMLIHSPFSHQLKIPREKVLIIAARGDGFCRFRHVQRLVTHWQNPPHHFLTGGHWLFFDRKSRGAAWYNFLRTQNFT